MPKEYLVVTIDTEADHYSTKNWKKRKPLQFDSVLEGIPKNLYPIFNEYKVKPVYLLTDDVISNKDCINLFKDMKSECELGTHLHFDDIRELAFEKGPEREFKELSKITNLFIGNLGYKPNSYRAGRFGINNNSIVSLKKLGYSIDTSITPYVDWRKLHKDMDYRFAPNQPYFVDTKLVTSSGDSGIFEVPVSIVPRFLRRGLWLRPTFTAVKKMQRVIDVIRGKEDSKDIVVYNMMFHIMEIYKDTSPSTSTKEKVDMILCRLRDFFEYYASRNINYVTLSELKEICLKNEKNKDTIRPSKS